MGKLMVFTGKMDAFQWENDKSDGFLWENGSVHWENEGFHSENWWFLVIKCMFSVGKIEVSMDTLMVFARKMKVISGKKLF